MSRHERLAEDLLWGVDAIARHLGLEKRQTYYLIQHQKIPVKKLGGKTIVARKSELNNALAAVLETADAR